MQTGILRALAGADRLPPGANLRAWLFTITRNEFISLMRKARSRGPHLPVDSLPQGAAVAPGQEAFVELRQLHRTLMTLPASERRLLGTVAYDGCSYAEAATGLGVPIGTVKSRIARTRARLRG